MIKTKKLKIAKEQLGNLPLFYNFVIYNQMIEASEEFNAELYMDYSEKFSSVIKYCKADKLISKIIDFKKIRRKL